MQTPKPQNMVQHKDLPAGDFFTWFKQLRKALRGEGGIEVPCGECVGCCSSSYFIHLTPEDAAVELIPKELLFPAPGLSEGHYIMGYDNKGQCPMLNNSKCSIYENRPKTCRDYDCRVFSAAGIVAGGEETLSINRRVERWQFSYPAESDREEHQAVQAAAAFIRDNANCFPGGRVPDNPSQLAILAIKSYQLFLSTNNASGRGDAYSGVELANAIVDTCRKFDEGHSNEH